MLGAMLGAILGATLRDDDGRGGAESGVVVMDDMMPYVLSFFPDVTRRRPVCLSCRCF